MKLNRAKRRWLLVCVASLEPVSGPSFIHTEAFCRLPQWARRDLLSRGLARPLRDFDGYEVRP